MLIIEDSAGRPIRGNSQHSDWHSDCLAMFTERVWLAGGLCGNQLGVGAGGGRVPRTSGEEKELREL